MKVENPDPSYRLKPKPLEEQIRILAQKLWLKPSDAALRLAKEAESEWKLSSSAEGWFAIANPEAIAQEHFPGMQDDATLYCRAAAFCVAILKRSRSVFDHYPNRIRPEIWRLHQLTSIAVGILGRQQNSPIWIVGGQLGKRHAGRSVQEVRNSLQKGEFGGYSVAAASILLTHPERFSTNNDLGLDLVGEECDDHQNYSWDSTPYFYYRRNMLGFAIGENDKDEHYGGMTLFLPEHYLPASNYPIPDTSLRGA